MDLVNGSPFEAASFVLPDVHGAETLCVVIKGTWSIRNNSSLYLAEKQVPVHLEPQYHSEPGESTLLHDTDVVLRKPSTDCILLGHAFGNGEKEVDVTFVVGPVRKSIRVFGERIWMKCLGKIQMSRPAPFEKIPLVYERSFGGRDESNPNPNHHDVCAENPVGRGFLARKSQLDIDNMRLPNLEDPQCLIRTPQDRPHPAGFAPIPREWLPRASFAGTCDDTWRKTRFPLPPLDLKPQFYLAAPAGQVSPGYLEGNERLLVGGASPGGRLSFDLPSARPQVSVRVANEETSLAMEMDTLVAEPDERRVTLTWRGSFPVHGKLHNLIGINVSC